ncbi:NAD(P)-dependent oxidoreductase [Colwellia psychrerythraea]|uniref:precorrin-2 dehydrogenase n=1 Tax=Colwellia psychrerythraea (strain 34H / ATCC BAA-681) TaxID=167879 RepID=Q489G9_COLP3|nr:NAD(P)-dependent oxidoreductase [Colwellia psychrerythraea]AAZ24923.1 siroheme synthase, N-terminal component [Colwellia psychrerythraea 34H]
MKYFPVFLDGSKINAMVVGGGDVAARKIELLLKTTTNITIMAENVTDGVERLINENKLNWLKHNYQAGLLTKITLVIAATDDTTVNEQVYHEAVEFNILANVVDQPALCTYITPAIIDRSPMIIALSSSGSAPILIRMLREQIEKILPQGYGRLADFSLKFRDHVKARIKGIRNRRTFWENTLRGSIGQALLDGKHQEAEQLLIVSLKEKIAPPQGEIIFIQTLEGNPDNLTLKAHRALQFADAVFYDDDVNIELIEYVRRDAEKYPQSVSSTLMLNYQHALELAQEGQQVIYLLSGNEELPSNAALISSGISTTIITNGS